MIFYDFSLSIGEFTQLKNKMNLDKLFITMSKFMKKYTNFMVWWKNNLDKVIKENKKLIIIFWHPLCIPCKKIMFKIPLIYPFYKTKWYTLKFCNVNENCQTCMEKLIHTTPTLIKYENWKEILRFEGDEVLEKIFKI